MKKISFLLILVGIALLLYPTIDKMYTNYQQRKMIDSYIELRQHDTPDPEELLRQIGEDIPVYDEPNLGEPEPVQQNTKASKEVIGLISIPKINVRLPILYDANNTNLNKGAALVKGTSFPWEQGNTAVAAHRGRSYGSYFNRLLELKVGDMIELEFLNETYQYQVYETFLVEPHEVWVLNNIPGSSTVTLITCDPPDTGTHRFIVRGQLKTP